MPSLGYKNDELLNMASVVTVFQRVDYKQMQFEVNKFDEGLMFDLQTLL